VTNVTFISETSPNTERRENVGGHGILYPRVYMAFLFIRTNYAQRSESAKNLRWIAVPQFEHVTAAFCDSEEINSRFLLSTHFLKQ